MKLSVWSSLLALMITTGQAHAGPGRTQLALDLETAIPLEEPATDTGGGGMLRLGYSIDAMVVSLTPEVGVGYEGFGGALSPKIYRGLGGARVSFGKILQPGVFAHAGLGRLTFETPMVNSIRERTAFLYDIGISLDLTLLPVVDLGAHAAYNCLAADAPDPGFDWISLGLHAALLF